MTGTAVDGTAHAPVVTSRRRQAIRARQVQDAEAGGDRRPSSLEQAVPLCAIGRVINGDGSLGAAGDQIAAGDAQDVQPVDHPRGRAETCPGDSVGGVEDATDAGVERAYVLGLARPSGMRGRLPGQPGLSRSATAVKIFTHSATSSSSLIVRVPDSQAVSVCARPPTTNWAARPSAGLSVMP